MLKWRLRHGLLRYIALRSVIAAPGRAILSGLALTVDRQFDRNADRDRQNRSDCQRSRRAGDDLQSLSLVEARTARAFASCRNVSGSRLPRHLSVRRVAVFARLRVEFSESSAVCGTPRSGALPA